MSHCRGIVLQIYLPGVYSGAASFRVMNMMQGAELNGVMPFTCECGLGMSFLTGFRYWNFDENLRFSTNSPFIMKYLMYFKQKIAFIFSK